ncbi:MAG: hypothetical protein KAY22_11875 [Rhizorhabdus sp.]|uniref:hypothetical protein n=1 Tax=Rhizorhabdus sp. TaxID=1968843 RepID=UPI001B3CDDAF|nr:hypothetical protein [Rhizorhabdus sp.]MBP8232995.1 hypothetical protein [Rhizorhabdus sp.]
MDAVDRHLHAECVRALNIDFWDNPSRWPRGGEQYVFLANAVAEAGAAQFGSDWTGEEIRAFDFVPDFPTLDRYMELLTSRPGLLGDLETHRFNWQDRRDKWNAFKARQSGILDRLMWSANWIGDHARDGKLGTTLRRVDTRGGHGAFFTPADSSLWNTEPLLDNRFYNGSFKWPTPRLEHEPPPVYAFFRRDRFIECIAGLRSGQSHPPAAAEIGAFSPVLQFAIRFAEQRNIISPAQHYNELAMRAEIRAEWQVQFGANPTTTQENAVYTAVRFPNQTAIKRGRAGGPKKIGST